MYNNSSILDDNNIIVISGTIIENFSFSHTHQGENFYSCKLSTKRHSGYNDINTIIVPEYLIKLNKDYTNERIIINGQVRTHNILSDNKSKLSIFVFAKDIKKDDKNEDINEVHMIGNLCKDPIIRRTPNNKLIADFILAVNRSYHKSDYLPCISWGRCAKQINSLSTGDGININARLQSRIYNKTLEDGKVIEKIAHEISVMDLQII